MTLIAPTLQMFFTDRLAKQRQASPATVKSYRSAFLMLLRFTQLQTGKPPSNLDWEDLNGDTITAFLEHLERDRGNSARSRNARLAAIRSLFRYAALRHPEHAHLIAHVLAIPQKRFDKSNVVFLEPAEIDALLAAPDRTRWEGRRDIAIIAAALQTGLRLSELTGTRCRDIELGTGPHIRCNGKGRKERCVPLTPATVTILRSWLQERAGRPDEPAFPTRTGRRLSDDALEARIALHAATARRRQKSMADKRVTVHTLRHSCAMTLLRHGIDAAVIALWLGHADLRSTNAYLHADMSIKERALARTTQRSTKPARYRPPDKLLAFLQNL